MNARRSCDPRRSRGHLCWCSLVCAVVRRERLNPTAEGRGGVQLAPGNAGATSDTVWITCRRRCCDRRTRTCECARRGRLFFCRPVCRVRLRTSRPRCRSARGRSMRVGGIESRQGIRCTGLWPCADDVFACVLARRPDGKRWTGPHHGTWRTVANPRPRPCGPSAEMYRFELQSFWCLVSGAVQHQKYSTTNMMYGPPTHQSLWVMKPSGPNRTPSSGLML